MSFYSNTIRRWATDTSRAGQLTDADGTGEVGLDSSTAGTRLAARITLKVVLDYVVDARYQVYGCGFSMAACAVAADMAVGCSLEDLQQIDAVRLKAALEGLPPERGYCIDLAVDALHAAARSAHTDQMSVSVSMNREPAHGARVTVGDPIYQYLMATPMPNPQVTEDRHLFACLLAVAAQETVDIAAALGLQESDVGAILESFFPGADRSMLDRFAVASGASAPEPNPDILSIIHSHLPAGPEPRQQHVSQWLAKMLATRAALPGHLWVAMGLTERSQLTAAIRRHLPLLAKSNNQNMRWKRYLYKQVCDLHGGVMCKSPNCGVCSDYDLCFAD